MKREEKGKSSMKGSRIRRVDPLTLSSRTLWTHARSRVTHEYRSKNREHRDIYTRGSVGDDVHLSRKFLISIVFSDWWSSPMISLFLPPPPIHKHNHKHPNPLLDNESVVFFSVSPRSRALFFLFSLFFSTIVFLRPLVSTPLSFSLYSVEPLSSYELGKISRFEEFPAIESFGTWVAMIMFSYFVRMIESFKISGSCTITILTNFYKSQFLGRRQILWYHVRMICNL